MQEAVARALAEELGITQDQAEGIILALTRHLHEQIAQDHTVYVPDLGTFTIERDALTMVPDERLKATVAGEFAGLRTQTASTQSRASAHLRWRTGFFAAFLAVIAAGAWWTLRGNQADEGIIAPFDAHDSTAVVPAQSPDSETVARTPSLADSLPAAIFEAAQPNVQEEAPSPVLPETPNGLDRTEGGYTLIVASFQEGSSAQFVAGEYRSALENVPVDVLYSPSDENYRVAVGQVQTIPEALKLKEDLPALPEDTWVLRIY